VRGGVLAADVMRQGWLQQRFLKGDSDEQETHKVIGKSDPILAT